MRVARISPTAECWMPERCFCSDFDAHGELGAGQRAEVLQALLREGAISLGDLESLEAPSFCSGLVTGGAWTAGVVVGLVLVSLIIQGFGFLWGRCRDRAPGDAEIPDRHRGAAPRVGPVDLGAGPQRRRRLFRLRSQPNMPP